MTIIDSHQHFWKFDPIRDQWITDEMKVLQRDFLPEDLIPLYHQNKINACVAVQAATSEEETEFLLGLANKHPFIAGVVGWLDLCAPTISERLTHYSTNKKLKGLRMILQDKPLGFMNRKDFRNGIGQLKQYHLSYDLLIYPHQLEEALGLIKAFPDQLFIIDHIAKPSIKAPLNQEWKKGVQKIAMLSNTVCKLSGMVTEAPWKQWKINDFTPYMAWVITCFGTHRVLFGSDWPVCQLSGSYTDVLHIVKSYLSSFPKTEQAAIFGGNAIQYYQL